jgi:hypothetical protein
MAIVTRHEFGRGADEGRIPAGNDNSIESGLIAWPEFQVMIKRHAQHGSLFSNPIVTTFSGPNAMGSGVTLSANGMVYFTPANPGTVQAKMDLNGVVTTYASVGGVGYRGGALSPNGDIHFVPYAMFTYIGKKINSSGVVSTYTLPYTTTDTYMYTGAVVSPSGEIHFIPGTAAVGTKISTSGVASTYSLVYTLGGSIPAHRAGVLAPNGDIHFVPYSAPVGQKINSAGTVSTYSLVYTTSEAYSGGVLAPNGDVHFVPWDAPVGQKIDINGVVSTYSLVFTGIDKHSSGLLLPNGEIHFFGNSTTGQKIDINGVVSTYTLNTGNFDANPLLLPDGTVLFFSNSDRYRKINFGVVEPFTTGMCVSPFFNKT